MYGRGRAGESGGGIRRKEFAEQVKVLSICTYGDPMEAEHMATHGLLPAQKVARRSAQVSPRAPIFPGGGGLTAHRTPAHTIPSAGEETTIDNSFTLVTYVSSVQQPVPQRSRDHPRVGKGRGGV